ncbi:ATP-binding cassette sub-family A member 5 [Lamellibrachia satsuma]|nr:ATP-binding cassette sub-family A member 5 [Lamellibrachia satsuma]
MGKESTATIIHYVCVIIDPPYALFGGLYYIQKIYNLAEKIQGGSPSVPFYSYFEWSSNIPICLITPVVHTLLFCFLLRLLDVVTTGGSIADVCGAATWWKSGNILTEEETVIGDEDSDVLEERKRVKTGTCLTRPRPPSYWCVMCARSFRRILAHRRKDPQGGEVYVAGYNVRSSLSSAFEHMGYCPQHDALWEEVTLEEHLQCYAALQGYSSAEISTVVRHMIKSLHVEDHTRKIAKKLSGGTKRKLSYAISMLGHPRVVLLDEPSTGMDPRSKRFLWDTISRSFTSPERGAILTTHYMEEAESLCNRVAIMVNGSMQCLGTLQQLKSKFGQGYLLEVKLDGCEQQGENGEGARFEALEAYIRDIFPHAIEVERFGERVTYRVPQGAVNSLSQTFTALEDGKQKLGIEEYSFSQSTLEQVFIEFAKHQYDDDASGNSDVLSRELSRQLSGECSETQ